MHFLKLFIATALSIFLITNPLLAQERTITGNVTSENGPLPGVNVMVMGSTYGNITDMSGNYTLNITSEETRLIFSYVGYKTVQETVGNRTVVDVYMEVEASQLEEVVVTGYTTQTVRNISGAIDVVDVKSMKTLPTSHVSEQLQGRAPGVTVTQSGMPGGPITVRIRGYSTINDNDPLYIIDGTPADQSTVEMLNPADIETAQVLKDASAASIYGARAANGVIIFTTRSGKEKGTQLSFDAFFGVQQVTNLPDLCHPEEVAGIIKTSIENSGTTLYHPQYSLSDGSWGLPDYLIPKGHSIALDGPVNEADYDLSIPELTYTRANKNGTNWLDQIFEPSLIQNYVLTASSGSEKGQFAFSIGYFDQEGIVLYNQYKKFTLRINSLYNINKRLRMGENLGMSYHRMINDVGFQGSNPTYGGNIINSVLQGTAEIKPVKDIAGNYTANKMEGIPGGNPVASLERRKDNFYDYFRLLGSVYLEFDILNDLMLKTSFSPNLMLTFENKDFSPRCQECLDYDNQISSLTQYVDNSFNWTWYNTLQYQTSFRGDHNLLGIIGIELIDDKRTWFNATKRSFAFDNVSYRHISVGEEMMNMEGLTNEWSLFSVFAKADYNYRGKYILSGTIRRDGSSRFSKENRYAYFPAVSTAWRISAEPFMSTLTFVNDLKFRAAWGQTGNQNIGNYRIFNTYSPNIASTTYDISGSQNSTVIGIEPAVFGNPNAKWETTTTINAGVDMTLFDNQLQFYLDWYVRKTTDLLLQVPPSSLRGQALNPYENIGEMRNAGVDFSLFYNSRTDKNFTWNLGINFTHYKNEVIKLYNPQQVFWGGYVGINEDWTNITTEGEPISSFYGLNILGIFQNKADVAESPYQEFNYIIDFEGDTTWFDVGRWKFEDVNQNDTIEISVPGKDDRTILGSPHPDFTFGIPLTLNFKGFDLSLFFYGSYGNEIYNATKKYTDMTLDPWGTEINSQFSTRILKAWGLPDADNETASLPQPTQHPPKLELTPQLSYFIEDGSYLKLKQLILGYNFKTDRWKGIRQFRMYFQANNLFTITKYQGIDPEITRGSLNYSYEFKNDLTLGTDLSQYPGSRNFIIGVNLVL